MAAFLADGPFRDTVVVAGHVGQQFLLVFRAEGVSVVGASRGDGQFRVDLVFFKVYLVVSGAGAFIVMAVGRCVVCRVHVPGHREEGDVQQVPVALVGVAEPVYHLVLVLVSGSAAEHGHGACLHHGVRQ